MDAGNYRKENSYIVAPGEDKKLRLIPLPDQGHAGYGTIPLQVSSFFRNALAAFKDKDDIQYIHLSPRDQGLKSHFFKGKTVPRKYTYRYYVSGDELEITDPVTKKNLYIDSSGKRIGRYITNYFKPNKDHIDVRILVEYKYNQKRRAELQKLSQLGQEDESADQEYKRLRQRYNSQRDQFRDQKKEQIQQICIRNNIVELYDGGSGGSYRNSSYYKLSGSKKSLDKALKELVKLNETTARGSFQIRKV
ncbi:hypothetical protein EBR78_10665 [bacterium]|nr:hypothetical protein [bacterium]